MRARLPMRSRTELQSLGMGEGEFLVELRERELGRDRRRRGRRSSSGRTRASPFAPVAETASGGELSRIALALAAVAGGETLVFDEIDAGIGGVTAHAVAATLQRLAERAQVLTITHLPQIASVADRHFRVEKVPGDPTHTRIEELDDLLRREELERMAGGAEFLASLAGGARPPHLSSGDPQRVHRSSWLHLTMCGGCVSEPHHLADWWPNIATVEPDRRGFAAGARWRVRCKRDASWLRRADGGGHAARPGRPSRIAASRSSSLRAELRAELDARAARARTLARRRSPSRPGPLFPGCSRSSRGMRSTGLHGLVQTARSGDSIGLT